MKPPVIRQLLNGITGALAAGVYNLAQDDAFSLEEWPLAQRVEYLDKAICDYCRFRNGQIVARNSEEYRRHLGQFHMSCRGIWVFIRRDEVDNEGKPTAPTWRTVDPDDPVMKGAHFIKDPDKYRALNVPARPTGRDFIYRPGEAGAPGTLIFAPAIPDEALRQTISSIGRVVFDRMMARQTLPADVNLGIQCANQSAARARSDVARGIAEVNKPDSPLRMEDVDTRWFDHFQTDLHHREDWRESQGITLSEQRYADLPAEIMAQDPDIAALRYWAEKRGDGGARIDCIAFHVQELSLDGSHLEDATFIWEVQTAQIWHAGRLDIPALKQGNAFRAIRGNWK